MFVTGLHKSLPEMSESLGSKLKKRNQVELKRNMSEYDKPSEYN